jgi:hypothetical protein
MLADAHEHVALVLEGVDTVQLARGDERVQDARTLGAPVASSEKSVLATDGDVPELALRSVVVELEAGVVEEAGERIPPGCVRSRRRPRWASWEARRATRRRSTP